MDKMMPEIADLKQRRMALRKAGLRATQADVATRAGINKFYMAQLEAGLRRNVGLQVYKKWACVIEELEQEQAMKEPKGDAA